MSGSAAGVCSWEEGYENYELRSANYEVILRYEVGSTNYELRGFVYGGAE